MNQIRERKREGERGNSLKTNTMNQISDSLEFTSIPRRKNYLFSIIAESLFLGFLIEVLLYLKF